MLTLTLVIVAAICAELAWSCRAERRRGAAFAAVGLLLLAAAALTFPSWLYFQKVVARILMPVGLLWAVGATVLALELHWRRWRRATAAAVCLLAFTLAGNRYLAGRLVAALEADFVSTAALDMKGFDAVCVMGGGTRVSPGGAPSLGDSGDRVALAARLYQRRATTALVASGSTIEGLGDARDLAAETTRIWVDFGVHEADIVQLPRPKNSAQEVAAYAELAREREWRRVGLVTSAWHMRRALAHAEALEFEVTPLPADFRGNVSWDGFASVVPDGAGFRETQRATWEYLGAAVGR